MSERKYTLQEAYEEILRIKQENALLEIQNNEIIKAYQDGYTQCAKDIQEIMNKKIEFFKAIPGRP